MSVVVVKNKVSQKDLQKASEEYAVYIKIVVDVTKETMAIGGQWHADAEKLLLSFGSDQRNLWGGGMDLKTQKLDYTALINIRPHDGNDSMEILDKSVKKRFTAIVAEKFQL